MTIKYHLDEDDLKEAVELFLKERNIETETDISFRHTNGTRSEGFFAIASAEVNDDNSSNNTSSNTTNNDSSNNSSSSGTEDKGDDSSKSGDNNSSDTSTSSDDTGSNSAVAPGTGGATED